MNAAALRLPAWWHWPPAFICQSAPGAYGFAVRTMAASMLGLGAAFFLQLESPYWSALTALIVANPIYGQIISKSVARMIGTVIGATMAVVFAAFFAQSPGFYLFFMSLWVGACMVVATLLRNFTAYGARLAGYTAPIIALAVVPDQPLQTFDTALARAAAIFVGIASSAIVSAVFKPGGASRNLELRLRGVMSGIAGLLEDLPGRDAAALKPRRRLLVKEVLEVDALVGYAGAESGRIQRQREELVGVAASLLHALTAIGGVGFAFLHMDAAQRANPRLRAALEEGPAAAADLEHFLHGGPLPDTDGARARLGELAIASRTADDPAAVPVAIHRLREALERVGVAARAWTDWRAGRPIDPALRARFDFHRDLAAALRNGLRCFLVVLIASAFWVLTAWPSGSLMVTIAAIFCCLAAVRNDPVSFALPFLEATALMIPVGYVVEFKMLPFADGFLPLVAVYAVPIMLATLAVASPHPKMAGMGVIVFVLFMMLTAPHNPMTYDVGAYLNSALALLAGAAATVVCSAFFLPPNPGARARVCIRSLCGEVEALARALPAALPPRIEWESRMYDRLSESTPYLSDDPKEVRALDSAFAALQIGVSLIDLRAAANRPELAAWRRVLDGALDRLADMAEGAIEAAASARAGARALLDAAFGLGASEGERGQRLLLVRAAASLDGISLLLDDQGGTFREIRRESAAKSGEAA